MEAFSQEKDEIILVFAEARGKLNYYKPFFIKASLRSDFASLTFPDQFDRARRNSVDLFTDLYDRPVTEVKSYLNERALGIELEGGDALVFKLFGNRSNIIHFDNAGQAVDLFNNKLVADQQIQHSQLTRPLDQSYEAYEQQEFRHEVLYPTFGKEVNAYLKEQMSGISEPKERWAVIQQVVSELENPDGYYLTILNYTPFLSLLPMGEVRDTYTDPLEALNRYYYAHVRMSNVEREKGEIVRLLRKRLQQTERYLENNFQKLIELEEGGMNEEMGHILMANLHLVPERAERVELYDFYRDQPITIKLKKDLSPQKNAEMYYRKAKNEKIEITKLQESSEAREQELQQLHIHLEAIGGMEQLRELRAYIKKHSLKQTTNAPLQGDLFKKVEYQGYTILIGRNAKNNDLLTRQYAYKEDLWLHARDVSGSHVVVKHQAGKNFPAPVIERAAQLAAWYSKRRTDTLCPVIVTPKKFVRKPKGLAEGAVIVDKEEVVLVEPQG